MPKDYNPQDWYWIVAGDGTKAYSSKLGDYVPATDATYVAWASDGTIATRIASEAELGEVLAPYSLRPTAANVLDGYQDSQSRQLTIQVVAKILFWLVNQVLTLKGQQTLTAAQFRTWVKGQM